MPNQHYLDQKHSLHELAHNAIVSNPYFFGQDIHVDVRGEDVLLRGHVNTYYQKQLAQQTVLEIEGVHSVQNDIQVNSIWARAGMRTPSENFQQSRITNTMPSWSF